ncbi:MAG: regulatory protein RecX, partial [Oleibacter sp.]|nr:regulatory protein RecX [Thalassolituus sp.]
MKKSTPDLLDRKGLQTAAVDLLSRRDYSRQELWRKLSPKAESSESLESVLSDLSERQWQSDERFASMFVRSRSSRGVGPRRLSQELRHKGVSEDITGHAIEEAEIDWYSQALEAAEK